MLWTKGQIAVKITQLIGKLPMGASQAVGAGLGRLIWHSRGRARHVAEANIAACFSKELSAQEQKKLAKRAVIETGKTITETSSLWNNPFEYGRKLIHTVHNEALLDAALSSARGLILILPHLGNWELTNHYITNKTNLLAMYQPAKMAELDALIYEARNRHGTTTVPTSPSGVKAIYKHLKKGGTTVILADQEPPPKSGRYAQFYQVPTLTPVLVPRLLKDTQAQALMIYTIRTPKRAQFEVHIKPVTETLYSHDIETATQGLNDSIEACVNSALPQYQWTYKRFKQRPTPNDRPFYSR